MIRLANGSNMLSYGLYNDVSWTVARRLETGAVGTGTGGSQNLTVLLNKLT